MAFTLEIPSVAGPSTTLVLQEGTSTFLVGANGGGKTRLAALAETTWGPKAHRISAHRALNLNPAVAKISEKQARMGLRTGYAQADEAQIVNYREGNRWSSKAATWLLDDFDFVVQTLFAEQSNVALKTHNAVHAGTIEEPQKTRFQALNAIWDRILPHRGLVITGDDISAKSGAHLFDAADMSDGERAVFYMLGQVLVAEPETVLIFDEPELHVHRAILGRLWDEVELARPDCAFLVITHDLDFAASRAGPKFAIRKYEPPARWEIEPVPENTGFSEDIATLILGSRKPILFVEGTGGSLDVAIYRACYPDWTVLPRGACEDVIHAVGTMRHNSALTRITCSGLVDADDYSDLDRAKLATLGVAVLPVSEVENIFLLPSVAEAILADDSFEGKELRERLAEFYRAVLDEVSRPGSIDEVVLRYCRRRIDRTLKAIDFTDVSTVAALTEAYVGRTGELDVGSVAEEMRRRIETAIAEEDIEALLASFDNKALLALAARHLKSMSKSSFESWLGRAMRNSQAPRLREAIRAILPVLTPQ